MKPIFRTASETSQLIQMFQSMSIGASMSYDEATKILGFVVASTTSSYQSAKRIAARDYGVVVDSIRGYGFQRIDGSGMVERAPRFFKKVRKGARREAHVQELAISQNLKRDEMLRATENLSRLRILETTAKSSTASTNRKVVEKDASIVVDNRSAIKGI